jgi:16S rRNA processing protein RimM
VTDRHNMTVLSPPGSDAGQASSEPAFLAVGRILRPHGLKGELRVEIKTDYPERFATHKRLYLGYTRWPSSTYVPYRLQGHRFHKGAVLLRLEGIDDRTQAEAFREQWVWVPIEEAVPLEEGECYLHQVLNLRVVTVEGEDLGQVTEIIETGANDVYVVQGASGEILLPDTEEVVLKVDVPAGQMTVRLIEGLR